MAHELVHAQGFVKHNVAYWKALAAGLQKAGKIHLIKYGFRYKQSSVKVGMAYGVAENNAFIYLLHTIFHCDDGAVGEVVRRFHERGTPVYCIQFKEHGVITGEGNYTHKMIECLGLKMVK